MRNDRSSYHGCRRRASEEWLNSISVLQVSIIGPINGRIEAIRVREKESI